MERRTLEDRFWEKVCKNGPIPAHQKELGPCWIWKGLRAPGFEYGKISKHCKNIPTHRVSWEIHFGKIPPGSLVLHKCDNPPCVNPTHLFLGSHQDNSDDKLSKNRQAHGTRNGKYTQPEKTPRGEKHGNAKATDDLVLDIRSAYDSGETNFDNLYNRFRKYGIGRSTIWRIVNRHNWTHI